MSAEAINRIIWEGERFIVQTTIEEQGNEVVQKILRSRDPSKTDIDLLENELSFAGEEFYTEGLRKVFGRGSGDYSAQLEFIDGISLSEWAHKNTGIKPRLLLAAKLASTLARIHGKGIIYRNFSPLHILVNAKGDPIYIDLTLATRVVSKIKALPGGGMMGDPNYMSPEQTGRINRVVDARSDLYSLGTILYWLFSGETPFTGNDLLEIVHAQIALEPEDLWEKNKEIPKQIGIIIRKLLSKNPESRYLSAYGVAHDLELCCVYYDAKNEIAEFEPGLNDFSGTIAISHKIYGRDEELKLLYDSFQHAVAGQKLLVNVLGFSGTGKTALVYELYEPVFREKCFFISGKYDRFQRDVPYSGFIRAIEDFVDIVFSKDEENVVAWKRYLHEAIIPLGKLITNLVPDIEQLIGTQPALPELNGAEAQNRFNYAFVNFMKALATPEHSLILFLDDLQWADSSSLKLLKVLMQEKSLNHVLFITTIRENEIDDIHPVRVLLNEINEFDHVVEMRLQQLMGGAVVELLKDVLQTKQENIYELAEIVAHKSQGNALFIHQFLKSVNDDGLLRFDFSQHIWVWDKEAIIRRNLSGDIEELLNTQIEKLTSSQHILSMAACIGPSFQYSTLAAVTNNKIYTVKKLIEPALINGIILETGSELIFSHDRIQHLLYTKIPQDVKLKNHHSIARTLLANADEQTINEHIFDFVYHWNLAKPIITDNQEKNQVIKLNQIAGKRAKNSAAYNQALQYFTSAMESMPDNKWQVMHDTAYDIVVECADAAYLCGNHELSEMYLELAFQNSKSVLEKVRPVEIHMQSYVARNQPLKAIESGYAILNELGIKFPAKPGKLNILFGLISTSLLLKRRSEDSIMNLNRNNDLKARATMDIIYRFLSAGYFVMPDIIPVSIFKLIKLTLKHGLDSKAPYVFLGFGYIQSAFLNQIVKGDKYADLSMNLHNKLDTKPLSASVYGVSFALVKHWRMPLRSTLEPLQNGFRLGQETGDVEFTTYLAHNIIYHSLYAGTNLQELLDQSSLLLNQVSAFNQELTIKRIRLFRQSISDLINTPVKPGILIGDYFHEDRENPEKERHNDVYFQNLFLQKLLIAYLYREKKQAWEYALEAAKYVESVQGSALLPVFYFFQGLSAADMAELMPQKKKEYIKIIKKSIEKFRKFVKYSDSNFGQKLKILEAVYYRVTNNNEKCQSSFFVALRKARQNKFAIDEALGWELSGEYYFSQGQDEVAGFYLQNAYHAYHSWGAFGKCKQLAEKYHTFISFSEKHTHTIANISNELDLATVIKAYNVLSGEIILSNLLEKMMHIMVENAGAQRGVLIREKKGELFIQAVLNKVDGKTEILNNETYSLSSDISHAIVNYAVNSENYVVIDDAIKTRPYSADPYVINHNVHSVICLPVKQKGNLFGYLYLENNLVPGVFTPARISLLNILSTQAAVSLENAELYNDLTSLNSKLTVEIHDKELAQKALEENERRLEEYNSTLEQKVEERTQEIKAQKDVIEEEKQKSEELLRNILPEETAIELKEKGRSVPRRYENTTVLFTDFVDFSRISENITPDVLVNEIHYYYSAFDEIIAKYALEKIKTIGDSYMCACGLPVEDPNHAINSINAAMEIASFVEDTMKNRSQSGEVHFSIRIGLHSGPVVAGIVGKRKFAYDIWGDTVNVASRMESNSEPGKINITEQTYEIIKNQFKCTYRGKISVKNKGEIGMYFVDSKI